VNLGKIRPKLIATDLDGTIVHHDGTITARTLEAFARARDLGVEIWFITGRPPRWMGVIKDAFGYGNAICCNGAMNYDLLNGTVIEEWAIPDNLLHQSLEKLRLAIPGVSFAVESDNFFKREKSYVAMWDAGIDHEGCNQIEEVLSLPILKLLVRCSGHEYTSDEMLEIAEREIGDLVNVTHSSPSASLLEISAKGVSKGETLALLAGRSGFSSDDCVSFGDNPNDFSMLQWCSRSYAIVDGHPDAQIYAKDVTEPHMEDGVAKIVEKLLDLPA
jgi:Cof subfamily protein (haloacid dehalogenase superfamily)